MIVDGELQEAFYPTVSRLLADPERLRSMRENVRAFAMPDADEKIAMQVLNIAASVRT
jgi:UDP-N-acetylglucosamine:LPS N-acetylglucosamine transferase